MRRAVAIGLALLALVAARAPHAGARAYWRFVSAPALEPPALAVTRDSARAGEGDLFLAAISAPLRRDPLVGHAGPVIYDASGNPLWVGTIPRGEVAVDFRTQTLAGAPVLTWWQGHPDRFGHGTGAVVIADSSYRTIAILTARGGHPPDFHDLQLSGDSVYVTADRIAHRDLRPFGGGRHGRFVDSIVEQIDIRTNRVVFEWDPARHISLRDTYAPLRPGSPWDPFHVNSIDVTPRGDLLISARNTSTVYYVDRRTGAIDWRLGGRRSSFRLASGAAFAFQHDARRLTHDSLSLFDNGGGPPRSERQSRALVLALDRRHHVARLVRAYAHPRPSLAPDSQGNVERLADGNVFVGWGASPYMSEYSPAGRLLFDANLHGPDESYRSFRLPWSGNPASPPSIAVRGKTAFASWNGATRVATWQVLTGSSPDLLVPAASAPHAGFETSIPTSGGATWYAVRALDAAGRVLGTSAPVMAR